MKKGTLLLVLMLAGLYIFSQENNSATENKIDPQKIFLESKDLFAVNRLQLDYLVDGEPKKTKVSNNEIVDHINELAFNTEYFSFEVLSEYKYLIKNIEVKVIRNPQSLQGQDVHDVTAFDNTFKESSVTTEIGIPITFMLTLCDNTVEIVINSKTGQQRKFSFVVNYNRSLPIQGNVIRPKKYRSVNGANESKFSVVATEWSIDSYGNYERTYTVINESEILIDLEVFFTPMTNYDKLKGVSGILDLKRIECPEGQPCYAKCRCRPFQLSPNQNMEFRQYLKKCHTSNDMQTSFEAYRKGEPHDCSNCETVQVQKGSTQVGILSSEEVNVLLNKWDQVMKKMAQNTQQMLNGNIPSIDAINALNEEIITISKVITKNMGNFSEQQKERFIQISEKYTNQMQN